jgi:diguanylate cyclase (GGDEF)-like protein
VLYQLEPRDERTAARTAAWIYLVSAVVIALSNVALPAPDNTGTWAIALGTPAALAVIGGLLFWPGLLFRRQLVLVTPLMGTGFVVFLDLSTHDASAGAQVAFCLPVLFGASQLRFVGAIVTALVSAAGDAVVVWQLKQGSTGLLDLVNVSLVLGLMTGLLVLAGQRQDSLVALLESQASLDPLTGLVTRRVLDEAVRRALEAPMVHPGTALILVDIDHFKAINDNYGHPVGDDVLVHIAGLLGQLARPDTVISRLGGDEIAVLLPGCTESVARERAYEFLHTVQESPLVLTDGTELAISISLGVAHAPKGESQLRELYANADVSLYAAKRGGRGRVGRPFSGVPAFAAADPISTDPISTDPISTDPGSERVVDRALEV